MRQQLPFSSPPWHSLKREDGASLTVLQIFVVEVILKHSTDFVFDLLDHNINNLQIFHQHNPVSFQKLSHHEQKCFKVLLTLKFNGKNQEELDED